MSYLTSLSSSQLSNIRYIIDAMNKQGITNPMSQAGLLAVLSKESAFKYLKETPYRNTSNDRIRKIFRTRLGDKSDQFINDLKSNDKRFFDYVYGGRYGNAQDEGYKYRGRGWNGLTFKSNYASIGSKVGLDLVNKPELLEDKKVATDSVIEFYKREFENRFSKAHQEHYNSKGINDFKDIYDSVLAFYHANTGFGKDMFTRQQANDSTGGLKRSVDRVPEFYKLTEVKTKKKNVTLIVLGLVTLAVMIGGTIYLVRSLRS